LQVEMEGRDQERELEDKLRQRIKDYERENKMKIEREKEELTRQA
jgi:predicted DNA binding CopG/RHH family protein